MRTMTFEELFDCGVNYETYVGSGTKEERARIPKNYSRINFETSLSEKISGISKKVNFLCVGEIWCPDCQLNLTVIKKMCEVNTNFEISVITRGRGQKFLSEALGLDEVKIPTVVILDENYEKMGVFLEQPEVVRSSENYEEIELDYLKGKYLSDTAEDILKVIG
ncbi:thioredoxin family protein [Propionigenium maris DSM 9537]|uniref:Thioredoxin family protein n=1 Tax=Propionigenium maris DSM 9537 TaxID=1123000 RepID=A0A9W6GNG2_9FUSO|nr:thioredoxin family protein [Propionigenium maris]GLI57029.1 thioredoxin family protein [Propionigenium maris DSM 9537]